MTLEKEMQTYHNNKAKLLAENKGSFVLIKEDKIEAIFVNYEDALTEGYKRFGNTEFLIKEIKEFDPVNFFSRELVDNA